MINSWHAVNVTRGGAKCAIRNVISVLLGRGTGNFDCRVARYGRRRDRKPKWFAIRVLKITRIGSHIT